MEKPPRLRVGLIGTGRLGRVYAKILATQIPEARLQAIAGHCAEELANEYDVPFWYADRLNLTNDPSVQAVVICSSTDTHVEFILESFKAKKPTFCEKPLTVHLEDTLSLLQNQNGVYFQAGFMRRFDSAYVAAKERIATGLIGLPMLFRATSRDVARTSMEYAKSSGGLILDMAIHDLDLARWFMGEVASMQVVGGRLFYPELAEIPDIDTAIITLEFKNGGMGVIDVSRRGAYGYDIATEVVGFDGAVRIGTLQGSDISTMVSGMVTYDTIPSFRERFEHAFVAQLRNFVTNVRDGLPSPVTLEDGVIALQLASEATDLLIDYQEQS